MAKAFPNIVVFIFYFGMTGKIDYNVSRPPIGYQ